MDHSTIRSNLIALADVQNADYPQYKGHFDNYVLVRLKKTIKTKMGTAFTANELGIARPLDPKEPKWITVYSFHNKCNTSVRAEDVEVL